MELLQSFLGELVCLTGVSSRDIAKYIVFCTVLRLRLDGFIKILFVPFVRHLSGLACLNLHSFETFQEPLFKHLAGIVFFASLGIANVELLSAADRSALVRVRLKEVVFVEQGI